MQVSSRSQGSLSLGASIGVVSVLALVLFAILAPAAMAAPATASYVVVLEDDVAHPTYLAHRHERNRGAEITHVYGVAIKGYSADLTPGQVKAIEKDPNVKYVESDGVIRPKGQAVGNQLKRVYANMSGLHIDENDVPADRVNADIAILDTGVYQHPDLNVVARVNCVGGGGGCKPGQFDDDASGHGTHVAGDAAAIDNGIGAVGTAPGARIWSVKVVKRMRYIGSDEVGMSLGGILSEEDGGTITNLEDGNAAMSDAIAGIDYVTAHSSEIEVANMSFACATDEWGCAHTALKEAIATSVNNGVVWVAAAGQEGLGVADNSYKIRHYPALLSDVITVSAMADYDGLPGSLSNADACPLEKGFQHDDRLMREGGVSATGIETGGMGSNYGPEVDITAPGSCVFSTWSPANNGMNVYGIPGGSEYGFMYGSSVASGLVAGAAADIAAGFNPNSRADVEKIRNALISAGNYNWEDLVTDGLGSQVSPDGVKEPLLDMRTFGAPAPSAPSVNTAPPMEVGINSAKLLGWLNPNGSATTFYFEFGTTASYGSNLPAAPGWSAGSANAPFLASYDLTSLQPHTTYHYRIVAINSKGTSRGADQTFTTYPHPPFAATNPATEIGLASAQLNAGINPNWGDTHYQFQYGTSPGNYNTYVPQGGGSVGSGIEWVPASNQLTGLQPGTTYYYRVAAWNSAGSANGAEQSFTTLGPSYETLPPGEVTSFKVTLQAKINPRTYSPTYYFEYGRGDTYGSKTAEKTLTAGSGNQQVSAAIEGLPVGWTVHYRLVINSSAGTITGPDQVVTTAWSNESSTGPAGSVADGLSDVSCPAAGACVAVGSYVDGAGATKASAERWNGTSWTPIVPTSPAGAYAALQGVSCSSAANCIAVGTTGVQETTRPLIMKWNGSAWSELSPGSQLPAGRISVLNDVSCPSATSCEAVGSSSLVNGAERAALAMHYDGSVWTVRTSANPLTPGGQPAQEANTLESVSCATTTFCKAVGRHLQSIGGTASSKPLIESLSGSAWASENADLVGLPLGSEFWLKGVSCPTASACLAVGYWRNGPSGEKNAFTERWSGSQWLREDVYSETNQATELYGVSCSSPTSCRAVGANGRGLHWGGGWALQAPKPPTDRQAGTPITLSGVACPTSTECHAVGSYGNSGGQVRLTQGWSGVGAVPAAASSNAVSITETSATMRGLVNPAGVDATYYFEYGPTTSYGSKTAATAAGSYNGGPTTSGWGAVNGPATALLPGKTYHYRVAITNGTATAYGADATFTTKDALSEMPVTEAFNGGTSNISDFATKWAPLQWAGSTRKGKNNANGYGPVDTALNGAYFIPTLTDGGSGVVNQVTIATGPGVGGRVSLWLDLFNPATEKRGYELSLQETAASTYTLTLRWRVGTAEKVLATQTGYSLPAGSQIALIDKGSEVSAWANTGSGYSKVISGTDTLFSSGSAGIEVQGSTSTRLTNFKVGPKAEKQPSFEAALVSVPMVDDFARSEAQLSLSGAWVALPWAVATVKPGTVEATSGWTPAEPSMLAGAYWQKAMASDTGNGDVAQVTSKVNFNGSPSSYFSVWLNAPNPASGTRNGYQLRLHGGNYFALEAKLYKWVNSVPTLLGSSVINCQNGTAGVKLALADRGSTLSVWSAQPGGTFTQAFSASDATYSYGYGGVEGIGASGVKDFKLGQLSPY